MPSKRLKSAVKSEVLVPESALLVVRDLITLGHALLVDFAALPTKRQMREVVLAGLQRRALVTTVSIGELLARGQLESAMALIRTLMDVELAVQLVTSDETDAMATRLVALDYRNRQKYGHNLLTDTETRAVVEAAGDKAHTVSVVRSWKDQFEGPAFESVRDSLERALREHRGWHGLGQQEDAFRAVGSAPEYFQQYALFSPFVHGINIESDFEEIRDGKPYIRDIYWKETERLLTPLGLATYRLYHVLIECVGDRAYSDPLPNADQQRIRARAMQSAKARLLEIAPRIAKTFAVDALPDTVSAKKQGEGG